MNNHLPGALLAAAALSISADALCCDQSIDISDRRGVQEMVVSVKFLDRSINLYEQFADYEVICRGRAPREQAKHWGLSSDIIIEQAVLRAPGMELGFLRLVKFHDVQQTRIRSSARPYDTGGIFNINMRAKDIDEAFEEMRDLGFVGFADPTYYEFHGKQYGGAMLRGHDGVVINLLTRVNGDYSDTPSFGRLSHVINATQMIGDFDSYEENKEFFSDKLGWFLRFEGEPKWPEDGSNNMSLPNSLVLDGSVEQRAAGFILSENADGGSIEIFSFDGVSGHDYSDRAHPPNLGVLMYRVHVPNLEAYANRLERKNVQLMFAPSEIVVPPYGVVTAFIVEAPSGAWIEFFEQRRSE